MLKPSLFSISQRFNHSEWTTWMEPRNYQTHSWNLWKLTEKRKRKKYCRTAMGLFDTVATFVNVSSLCQLPLWFIAVKAVFRKFPAFFNFFQRLNSVFTFQLVGLGFTLCFPLPYTTFLKTSFLYAFFNEILAT